MQGQEHIINSVKGARRRIDDFDIPRIGNIIGVGEDEVHAIMDVESNGRPFDRYGRVTMLYEKHIFYRQLPQKQKAKALNQGLARTKWVRDYPRDSYPIFAQAAEFNRDAAFRSCSWGIGQIMGFNCELAGYKTAEEMVKAFADDEAAQLEAMIVFIDNAGIAPYLRAHDWDAVARRYNGPGYKRNNYHIRLRQAFEWWQKKPDTPWEPTDAAIEEAFLGRGSEESQKANEKAQTLSREDTEEVEEEPKKASFWSSIFGSR